MISTVGPDRGYEYGTFTFQEKHTTDVKITHPSETNNDDLLLSVTPDFSGCDNDDAVLTSLSEPGELSPISCGNVFDESPVSKPELSKKPGIPTMKHKIGKRIHMRIPGDGLTEYIIRPIYQKRFCNHMKTKNSSFTNQENAEAVATFNKKEDFYAREPAKLLLIAVKKLLEVFSCNEGFNEDNLVL